MMFTGTLKKSDDGKRLLVEIPLDQESGLRRVEELFHARNRSDNPAVPVKVQADIVVIPF